MADNRPIKDLIKKLNISPAILALLMGQAGAMPSSQQADPWALAQENIQDRTDEAPAGWTPKAKKPPVAGDMAELLAQYLASLGQQEPTQQGSGKARNLLYNPATDVGEWRW
jgi:hypothetical protein